MISSGVRCFSLFNKDNRFVKTNPMNTADKRVIDISHWDRKEYYSFFGNMPVNAVTVAHVRQWQNQLLEGDKYSHNFLHTVNGDLSAIFNHAVKFYGLPKNPSKECGKIQEKRPELQFWTLDQFNQFIKTVEGIYPAYTMLMLLFWTGMRSGELLALTLNDFDFEKHKIDYQKPNQTLNVQNSLKLLNY